MKKRLVRENRKLPEVSAKTVNNLQQPDMPWQKGDYARLQQFEIFLPSRFLMLCKILEVKPETVILDFFINLDAGGSRCTVKEQQRQRLLDYFLLMGYGNNIYSQDEPREMFKEIAAMALLFPKDAALDLGDSYKMYQEKYYHHWFHKWYDKLRRVIQSFLI